MYNNNTFLLKILYIILFKTIYNMYICLKLKFKYSKDNNIN